MPYSYRRDLTGLKFGRLTVLGWNPEKSILDEGCHHWFCRCSCGNEVSIRQACLLSGMSTSCGCYQRERSSRQNKYEFLPDGSVKFLSNNTDSFFVIDAVDFERISRIGWSEMRGGYFRGKIDGRDVRLHRYILEEELGDSTLFVDHIRSDEKWDNRRSNLRLADASENSANSKIQKNNTSKIPGVSWYKASRKWRVQVRGQSFGYFDVLYDAFLVSKAMHYMIFKEFTPHYWQTLEQELFPEEFAKSHSAQQAANA